MTTNHPDPAHDPVPADVRSRVESADAHGLILILFDSALAQVSTAGEAIAGADFAERDAAIARASEIIGQGLRGSLNMEAGGEISSLLAALYGYIIQRLAAARNDNSAIILGEVGTLLSTLREAWAGIGDQVHQAQ